MLQNPAIWTLGLLALGASGILLFGHRQGGRTGSAAALAATTLFLVAAVWTVHAHDGHGRWFDGMFVLDAVGSLAALATAIAGLVTVFTLTPWLRRAGKDHAEVYALLLFAVAGMQVMLQTSHLATLFLGLETMSIALYALCACMRERREALEAGFKYFITGAFASALLLMAIALVYGLTGSMDLEVVRAKLQISGDLGVVAMVLFVAAFGFKLSLVPFHQWAPDVYQGAPTPLTGFMATAVKVTGFVALLRLLPMLQALSEHTVTVVGVLAVATMLVGNLSALAQQNVKRMLAFSSVAHAGYLLAGIAVALQMETIAPNSGSVAGFAVVFYLFLYTLMNLGAFGVLSMLERSEGGGLTFADLAGLKQRRPWLAGAMLVCMLSLAGVPLTGGFLAKWRIFEVLVPLMSGTQGTLFTVLTATLALASLIGLAYYLRVVLAMYVEPAPTGATLPAVPRFAALLVVLLAAALVWLGCAPGPTGSEGLAAVIRAAFL